MKPICKAEARWKYWREENPNNKRRIDKFTRFAKRQMKAARRRYLKG